MSTIRYELINTTRRRANRLMDYKIYNDIHKQFEFKRKTILNDKSLTNDEKIEAVKEITKSYDRNKIINNSGTRRICENCNQECLATLYCEYCIQNYLKENFSNWTSGNDDIDNLIQKCQIETYDPIKIFEWIPYNNFKSIKYLTKGGCSEIYIAKWVTGRYEEWDSKKKKIKKAWNSWCSTQRIRKR